MNPGLAYAALAYTLWGLFPLYFRQVAAVPAFEIVVHRSVWALVFVLLVLAVMRRWAWLGRTLRQPKPLGLFAFSALLLSSNWLVYIWAVNNHRVIDSSLGYFINPLVSVVLGFAVLHERLRRPQWAAVALAAFGVLWLLAPLALGLLAWWTLNGTSAMSTGDASLIGWLFLAGPLTAVPLLLFAAGARRLTLATLGLLQYIAPTLQFGLGVWLYREPFDSARLIGFAFIWAALAIYSAEGWWVAQRRSGSALSAA